MKKGTDLITKVNNELSLQLSNKGAMKSLLATSFKGFKDPKLVQQACFEMMMRNYEFSDIVKKKIYAIPYGNSYSLVQSINDVRAIAMKNGLVGKNSPIFEEVENKIVSCEITIKKKINDYVGDFTAKVYFEEYNTNRNQWKSKPRTMISKVAEMHALRMAFPEDLSDVYTEEEFEKEAIIIEDKKPSMLKEIEKELESAKSKEEVLKIHEKYAGNGKDVDNIILEKLKDFKEVKNAEVVEEKMEVKDEDIPVIPIKK